jgi:hypothetical protein
MALLLVIVAAAFVIYFFRIPHTWDYLLFNLFSIKINQHKMIDTTRSSNISHRYKNVIISKYRVYMDE